MMEEKISTEGKRTTLSEKEAKNIEELLKGEPLYHLDPGVRIYWSIGMIAAGLVVWIILMLVAGFTLDSLLGISTEMFPLFFFTLVIILLLPYLVWIELNYHNYTYQFRKKRIVIRKGVLNKERTVIPYTQIQNININRNVLQRALGIATIKIETAGTNPWESEGIIDGIGDYHSFVQHAMELVELSKHKREMEEKKIKGEDGEKGEEDEIFYLKQILVQLLELKKVMELKDKPAETAKKPKLKEEIGKLMRGKKKKKG